MEGKPTTDIPTGDIDTLISILFKSYPGGLRGEREALVRSLMAEGLDLGDAEEALRWLEEARHAHLVGDNWVFTRHPVGLPELLRSLDEEYPAFVGRDRAEPRAEAAEFIASRMGLDEDVAREVLEDLEAAGYAALDYDPEEQRTRMLFRKP